MKTTIFKKTILGVFVVLSCTIVSALSYPLYYNSDTYTGQYVPAYGQNDASYTYTTGCNTYHYNGYTRTTTLISSCTNYNTSSGYNPSYTQYVQPITQVSYVAPITTTHYVAPITTSYTVSPINSYGYTIGYYGNGYNYGNYSNQNTIYYNSGYNSTYDNTWTSVQVNFPTDNTLYNGGCYYSNGYQVCP